MDFRFRPAAALGAFVAASVIFLYLQIFVPPLTPVFLPNDHWIFLENAQRILRGQVLYKDIFQFTFPGIQTLFAAMISLFGSRVWLPNLFLLFMFGGTVLFTTLIAKSLLAGWAAYLPAVLLASFEPLAWHVASHNWLSTLAAMAALWVLLENRSWPQRAAAGGLCALAACFPQTRGLAVLLGLVAFTVWEQRSAEFRPAETLWLFRADAIEAAELKKQLRAASLR